MIKSNTNFNINSLMKDIKGNKILDYAWRTRTDEKYIPQEFNGRIVFQSFDSFQQNNKRIGERIRKYVSLQIRSKTINSIGGESYLYDITKNGKFYSNSKSIHQDSLYNQYNDANFIDYNIDKINILSFDTVINLTRLNINIMKQINNSSSNRLIIINCHHQDFWKKIKLLTNYKLIIRKKFIDYRSNYFITVNVFIRKSFVSLGGNCAITYQLNYYNLRNKSYPFDWYQIKLNKLKEVYENNFKNFESIEIQKYSDNHSSFIVKNSYGKFAHEVLKEVDMDGFKSKLIKRIENFKEIKNPTFIRLETFNYTSCEIYKEYWSSLISLLDNYFDNYQIILISKLNPKLNKIKWFSYQEFNTDWRNNNLNWKLFLDISNELN
jgi:hypothetical protein